TPASGLTSRRCVRRRPPASAPGSPAGGGRSTPRCRPPTPTTRGRNPERRRATPPARGVLRFRDDSARTLSLRSQAGRRQEKEDCAMRGRDRVVLGTLAAGGLVWGTRAWLRHK